MITRISYDVDNLSITDNPEEWLKHGQLWVFEKPLLIWRWTNEPEELETLKSGKTKRFIGFMTSMKLMDEITDEEAIAIAWRYLKT